MRKPASTPTHCISPSLFTNRLTLEMGKAKALREADLDRAECVWDRTGDGDGESSCDWESTSSFSSSIFSSSSASDDLLPESDSSLLLISTDLLESLWCNQNYVGSSKWVSPDSVLSSSIHDAQIWKGLQSESSGQIPLRDGSSAESDYTYTKLISAFSTSSPFSFVAFRVSTVKTWNFEKTSVWTHRSWSAFLIRPACKKIENVEIECENAASRKRKYFGWKELELCKYVLPRTSSGMASRV